MYCIRESFQQRSTGIVFHPQLAQSPCSQCFSSFLYRSNPEPVLHGVRIWCTPSLVHSLWRHFLVAFFGNIWNICFAKKLRIAVLGFVLVKNTLIVLFFINRFFDLILLLQIFYFFVRVDSSGQPWPKNIYISIKNTKQPFLLFIPPPFTLESRKCKENS